MLPVPGTKRGAARMPAYELLIPFFIATSIFACVPGPGMFYAAAQTIARGRRAGWLSAVGLHIGGYAHILAAALGLAVLLELVPVLYTVLKFAGAAYLIWLGIRIFTSQVTQGMVREELETRTRRRAFWESVTVEVLNPKTALFYLAFLPQFTDMNAALPIWGQILVLGVIVNFMFSGTDVVCVLLSERITKLLVTSRAAHRWAHRVGGGIVVALGVNLAASRQ
jgi:threonine/homoserine/homoserine lactone efflux protein